MVNFLKRLFKKSKPRYRLKYWSTDFNAFQVYLKGENGNLYFRGFACYPETNFNALIKNENRLGAKTDYIIWAKNYFKC